MSRDEFESVCWRYYLLLEKSFDEILRYVELDKRNYRTFSFEFIRQLQSIGAEVDAVLKIICGFRSDERKTTAQYCPIIISKYADILQRTVKIREISIKPFEGWDPNKPTKSLFWYDAYNEIKHSRTGDFTKANLKNTLYALAGLFLLEMNYLKEISDNGPDGPMNVSTLFSIEDWHPNWINVGSNVFIGD